MKQGIHPEYREVIYRDAATGFAFLTRSTVQTEKTMKWEDGNEYPLITVEISSDSHPFFTGQERLLDTEGRIDRFRRRYEPKGKKK